MHRIIERSVAPALFAALVFVAASLAQPPGRKDGSFKGIAQAPPITVDDIVERLMAFDKNKDGKVTKNELPDRMHHLIERGDTNKDGALDRDEIKQLAARLANAPGGFGGGGQIRVDGPGAGGGFAKAGFAVAGPGRLGGGGGGGFAAGGAGRFGPLDPVEGVVDDLKLSAEKKGQALAAVKAHQESVRRLMDQARAELLAKMKTILSEEEFNDFQAALDRPRGQTFFNPGPRLAPKGGSQPKLDQQRK